MFRNRKTNVFPKMLSEKIYHRKHILPFSMLNRCSVIYSIKSSLHMCLLCDMVRKYAWTGVTFVYLPSNKKNGCVEFNRRHKMCAPEVSWRCNLCVKSIRIQRNPYQSRYIGNILGWYLFASLHIASRLYISYFLCQIFSRMGIKVFITNISSSTDVSVLLCLQNLTVRFATPTF